MSEFTLDPSEPEEEEEAEPRGSRALTISLCAAVVLVLVGTGITTAGIGARNKARNDIDAERMLVRAQSEDVATARQSLDMNARGADAYWAAASEMVATASEMARIGGELVANSQAKLANGLGNLPAYNALGQTTNRLIGEYNATVDRLNTQNNTLRAILAGETP